MSALQPARDTTAIAAAPLALVRVAEFRRRRASAIRDMMQHLNTHRQLTR
jgi:hypothetical protein